MPEINKPTGNALNKIWASSGAISVPDDSKISTGWNVEAPPHEVENFLNNKHDTALAHANQHGGFVWDGGTEYIAGKSWTQGSNGNIYKCLVTNINQNPVTDVAESYWRPVLTGNKLLESSEVSAYMKTMLDDPNKNAAKTTLGLSSLGISITEAGTSFAVRQLIGAGSNGDSLFTSSTAANSRSVLGITSSTESTEGLSQRASDAEAIAGVNDSKFLTPKKLRLGFSISLTQPNGYIIFPSWIGGLIIQWGRVFVSGDSSATWNYPVVFPSSNLSLQATLAGTFDTQRDAGCSIYSGGTNSATVRNGVATGMWVNCLAIGY